MENTYIDIDIYINNQDYILHSSYSQYIINYLANVYPATTNNVKQIRDVSYIIYNYNNPLNVVSNSDIFIDSSNIDVRYVQYLNNWRSGRNQYGASHVFFNEEASLSGSTALSIFNSKYYYCNVYQDLLLNSNGVEVDLFVTTGQTSNKLPKYRVSSDGVSSDKGYRSIKCIDDSHVIVIKEVKKFTAVVITDTWVRDYVEVLPNSYSEEITTTVITPTITPTVTIIPVDVSFEHVTDENEITNIETYLTDISNIFQCWPATYDLAYSGHYSVYSKEK